MDSSHLSGSNLRKSLRLEKKDYPAGTHPADVEMPKENSEGDVLFAVLCLIRRSNHYSCFNFPLSFATHSTILIVSRTMELRKEKNHGSNKNLEGVWR